MVKTQSRLQSREKKSLHLRFFKVFIPTQSSQRLRIPPDFIKHLNGEITSKSTITSSEPRSWPVDVIEIDDNLYLDKGWERFVQDNALEFGDFLVFHYAGEEDFRVKIFAKDGCLKGINKPTAVPTKFQGLEHRKSQQVLIKENPQRSLRPRNPETGRVRRGEGKNFSKFPFFKTVVKPAYISGGLMNIPSMFSGSYLKPFSKSVSGLLIVLGKSWPVKLLRQKTNSCVFSAGWRLFYRETALKVGDVCVFRLVDRKDYSFTVTISRNENRM